MKRKVLSVVLAVAMVATLAVGCGSKKSDDGSAAGGSTAGGGGYKFEIVSKGFQHQYWQAVLKGAQNKAKELGDTINFVGPDTESDTAQQLQQFQSAVNAAPNAIGLAALDTQTLLDAIQSAQDANIPIVGFDSGVPDAPEGAVLANVSTDNYKAGEMAAEETYKALKDRIGKATGTVRVGVLSQDSTSESVVNRGLGFIDKFGELAIADGKTVMVEGNDKFISDAKVKQTKDANVVIEVAVPAKVDATLSQTDCETILNKADTIAVYGSNQHSGEAMVNANDKLKKFGAGDDQVIGVAFDSGEVIKGAVADGTFLGAITQAPVAMGEALVQALDDAASGKTISDVDTGCQWYTKDNMNDAEIAQNLYD